MKKLSFAGLLLVLSWQLNAQNVGIGTATPGGKLQLNHRASGTSPTLLIFDSSTTNAGRQRFLNTSGPRYWELSAITNNFANRNAQYFDIQTDSSIILTLRANGNVGINNLSPSYPLDVRGDINLTGTLRVGDNGGANGQVLTSNGNGGMEWRTATVTDNTRFSVSFTSTAEFANMPLTTHYNLNTSNVVISGTTITINKSGLYHFDGQVSGRASFAAVQTDLPQLFFSINNGGTTYPMVDGQQLHAVGGFQEVYSISERFSFNLHIIAPRTITLPFTLSNSGGGTYSTRGWLNAYWVSE